MSIKNLQDGIKQATSYLKVRGEKKKKTKKTVISTRKFLCQMVLNDLSELGSV